MCSVYKKTTHKKFITVEHIDCIMHARKANYKDQKKFYGSATHNWIGNFENLLNILVPNRFMQWLNEKLLLGERNTTLYSLA